MIEKIRLPPIPPELTSQTPDPTTKIKQTPDGQTIVHSVRKGVEGHLDFRADGSYKHHSNTGSIVEFAANNHLMYQKGGITHTTDNNHDTKIAGQHRHDTDTDSHTEIGKNMSYAFNGMQDEYSTGHGKFAAADIYHSSTSGSIVHNSARDIEMTATKGRITTHSTGVQTHTTDQGDFHVAAGSDVDLNSQANTLVTAQQNITATAQQSITTSSQKDTTINSKQNVNVTAQQTVVLNKAVTIGGASSLGQGTLNVTAGVYLNGSAYANPDYALEHFFNGEIKQFANNKGASDYTGLKSIPYVEEYMKNNLSLPGISKKRSDIFERADMALEKIEELFIYIIQLHKRIEELEKND